MVQFVQVGGTSVTAIVASISSPAPAPPSLTALTELAASTVDIARHLILADVTLYSSICYHKFYNHTINVINSTTFFNLQC